MRIRTNKKKECSRIDSISSGGKSGGMVRGPVLSISGTFLGLILFALIIIQTGCNSIDKRKYIVAGPIVGEKVQVFEDYWSDYGTFKPADSEKKMRRGKAGVIRFFKEGNYVRSVRVDGSLVVYVFEGTSEGVELTQPHAKLVLSPEQLEKQRKYDKKIGHAYHVWLDLGEIDLPEADISIMSVFTDANSGEQTTSKLIHTTVPGKPKKEIAAKKNGKKREIDEKELARLVEERVKEEQLREASRIQAASNERTITTIDLENGSGTLYSLKNGAGIPNSNTAPPSDYSRFSAQNSKQNNKNNTDLSVQGLTPSMQKKYTLEEIRHLAFNPTQPGNPGASSVPNYPTGTSPRSGNRTGLPQTANPGTISNSQFLNYQKNPQPYQKAYTGDPIDSIVPEVPSSESDTQVFLGPAADRNSGIIRR
ncbi:MAG: hypothetical protein Q4G69_08440 [Planctomycetia bacterium]|nr:hypothetical protein [Planctomycetia bacterium]